MRQVEPNAGKTSRPLTPATNWAVVVWALSLVVVLNAHSPVGAQTKQARPFSPGETWGGHTVVFGQPVFVVIRLEPKGRLTAVAVSGGINVTWPGRYTYADGVLTVRYDNGHFDKSTVPWLDRKQALVTCTDSNIPAATGSTTRTAIIFARIDLMEKCTNDAAGKAAFVIVVPPQRTTSAAKIAVLVLEFATTKGITKAMVSNPHEIAKCSGRHIVALEVNSR